MSHILETAPLAVRRDPIGRGAAHQAKAKRETAGEWRRNALKRLNLRPEMVVSRKSEPTRSGTLAGLTVRDSG
jgi:hypothetical protein